MRRAALFLSSGQSALSSTRESSTGTPRSTRSMTRRAQASTSMTRSAPPLFVVHDVSAHGTGHLPPCGGTRRAVGSAPSARAGVASPGWTSSLLQTPNQGLPGAREEPDKVAPRSCPGMSRIGQCQEDGMPHESCRASSAVICQRRADDSGDDNTDNSPDQKHIAKPGRGADRRREIRIACFWGSRGRSDHRQRVVSGSDATSPHGAIRTGA
jgi:hypothetical protein